MKQSPIEIDLGSVTMSCTPDEIAATLVALLGEMRAVIPRLRQDERIVLREIMSRESGALTVADIFPEFARESEGHRTLRRLRAAQFVRPARTGRWDPIEPIEVKPFARLMWDHIGEDAIFAGLSMRAAGEESVIAAPRPVAVMPHPAEEKVEEEVVDLRDVEEAEVEEPIVAAKPSAAFEDVDVLDSGDDDLFAFAQMELRGKR